jgi:beta-glucosidase
MNFLWGAATSSHQVDGLSIHNDWWHWEQQGNIERGETSGKATDHWNRFREDIRAAAEMGLNTYRFSIEWSRLEPEEGQWDKNALGWYENLIDACESAGLLPMATLHHFTIPEWLARRGGITSEHYVDKFAGFVRKVAPALVPRVPLWCTINEPVALVVGAYLGGYMPPALCQPKLASLALRNLLRAHVRAYDILHAERGERRGPWKAEPLMVGMAHNMIDFRPLRPHRLVERAMSHVFRRFYNRAWLDAVTGRRQHFGVWGLIPYARPVWEARGRRTVDFIGINYYTKVYVCWGPQPKEAEFVRFRSLPIGVRFSLPQESVSDLGWPVHPKGLGRMIRFVKGYGLPIFITENGIADAGDRLRPQYLVSHLREVAQAIAQGADIRGYYHWSLLDNFEWIKGFPPRFGLLAVDYETFERKPRASAALYRRIIEAHRGSVNGDPELSRLAGFGEPDTPKASG